jgi:hypothetical protein
MDNIKKLNLYNLIKPLLETINTSEELYDKYNSYSDFILNHRTLSVCLPRRSGKTTTLIKLSEEKSALFIVKHTYQQPICVPVFNSMDDIIKCFGYKIATGLKYECVLIDEEPSINVQELINFLAKENLVTDNFFVLQLMTPVSKDTVADISGVASGKGSWRFTHNDSHSWITA